MFPTAWILKFPVFSAMKKITSKTYKRIWVSTEVMIMAFSIALFREHGPQQGDNEAAHIAVGAGTS